MAPANLEPNDQSIPRRARIAATFVLLFAAGCQTMPGPIAWMRSKKDDSYAEGAPSPDKATNASLLARWLTPAKTPHASGATSAMVLGDGGWTPIKVKPDPASEADLAEGQKLAQEGQAGRAEAVFHRLARRKKGTPWGEKAQFYLAESQYKRGKLVEAHESYEQLIKDYPGTEFLDQLVSREYQIAQTWLAPYKPDAKAEEKPSAVDRVNGRFPMVDASGHALKALEHVRLHDPTGPLSDDAVKRTADYFREVGNHESAALYYDQLVADHPKSPFLRDAQLASIDEKLKAYWGPDYDGRNLDGARDMIKQTMAAFPERQAGSEKLYQKLDLIGDQEAERAYNVGDYYMRTGKVASAEFYFGMIVAKWPKTEWAGKAKTHMATLAKMERKKWQPSTIMSAPGGNDPFGGSGGQGPSTAGPNGLPNSF